MLELKLGEILSLMLGDNEGLIEILIDGLSEGESDCDGLTEGEMLSDMLGLNDSEIEGESEGDKDCENDGDKLGLKDVLGDSDGLIDGDNEALGERLGDIEAP